MHKTKRTIIEISIVGTFVFLLFSPVNTLTRLYTAKAKGIHATLVTKPLISRDATNKIVARFVILSILVYFLTAVHLHTLNNPRPQHIKPHQQPINHRPIFEQHDVESLHMI